MDVEEFHLPARLLPRPISRKARPCRAGLTVLST
jgi:hypothetical protein